jgi:predicted DNA-binding ribbon-helix-helix protein
VDGARNFAGPVKHSVTIARHETSISLEPPFWDALRRAAAEEGIALNALVARIDEERIAAFARPVGRADEVSGPSANLASAIRTWLWYRYCK